MRKSSKKIKKLQQRDISFDDEDNIKQRIQNADSEKYGIKDSHIIGDNNIGSDEEYDSEMDSMNLENQEDFIVNDTTGEDEDGESESDEQDVDEDGESESEEQDIDDDGLDMKIQDTNHGDMEELEKEYKDLRNKEQDLFRNIRRDQDDDILKGQAVKNQRALWDKTLEFRFLLQKSFSTSNRLPQEPVRSAFCNCSEEVKEAYSDLVDSTKKTLDSILKLQEALIEKNPSIMGATEEGDAAQYSKSLDAFRNSTERDEEWFPIFQMQSRIAPFRNISVDKWQRKTQVTTGTAGMKNKFQAFNQNISEQVATYMRDPSRMIKGMQQRRSVVPVFGDVCDSTLDKNEAISADDDPELLDDSEFYQQLLREFFETVDPGSSETAFYAMKRLQTKKRKIVDRRASKSRKIRYHVHEKIVNFMAPEPMKIPPTAPKLFENLFGLKPAASVS
ncbi:hypothetical protein SSX86_004104 [Deinandra increscens subsp. villosa]|uniref:Apoptosis antagonizing transcription factor n=1 Tax=Deinandra increscens subsp. villosa TaxID=3103831 RepID=A0AAP0DIL7_9ASTR